MDKERKEKLYKDFVFKNNQVFYGARLLVGMVAEEFEVIDYESTRFRNLITFLKDKKGIWLLTDLKKGVKFVTEDSTNFEVISDHYAKDNTYVYEYYKTLKKIPNADPSTFQVLKDTPYFAKDKNQCYAMSGSGEGLIIIDDADPASFGACSWNQYAVDKDNLYHYNYHFVELSNDAKFNTNLNSENLSEDFDLENTLERNKAFLLKKYPNIIGWWHPDYKQTFSDPILEEICTEEEFNNKKPFYHIENKSIYYCKYDEYAYRQSFNSSNVRALRIPTIIRNVEIKTFEILNEYYAKDKNTVFFKHRKVNDIDVRSAQIISDIFIKDKTHCFYNGYKIEEADPASFEIAKIDFWYFAKDDQQIFHTKNKRIGKYKGYDSFMVPLITYDKDSFINVVGPWAKDKNNIYYKISPVLSGDIDVNTFEVLKLDNYSWFKDKNALYYLEEINRPVKKIKDIDAKSFQKLNKFWGKDKNVVFNFEEKKIFKRLDVNTFEVLDNNGKAQDKNYICEYQKQLPPKKFRDDPNIIKMYEGFSSKLKIKKR